MKLSPLERGKRCVKNHFLMIITHPYPSQEGHLIKSVSENKFTSEY